MLRKLLLGGAAALALAVPSFSTSTAQAHGGHVRVSYGPSYGYTYYYQRPIIVHRHVHHDYRVWYRKSCYEPWQCYSSGCCYTDACRYYDYLCGCGYEVRWGY
jgi:hypothetical protein